MEAPGCIEKGWYRPEVKLPYTENTWEAIYHLLKHSWFSRVWIWQEIHLANSKSILVVGHDEISWGLFRRAIICLFNKGPHSSRENLDLLDHTYSLCQKSTNLHLPALLALNRFAKSSLPVDKIYGIFGLAPDRLVLDTQPNYQQHYGLAYKAMFLDHISLVRRLELFGSSQLPSSIEGYPSWVPNWSKPRKATHLRGSGHFASGFSSAYTKFLSPNVLEVTGIQCSTIQVTGQSSLDSISDLVDTIGGIQPETLRDEFYVTGEPLVTAYAWTLSLGWLRDRFTDSHYYLSLQEMENLITKRASHKREDLTNISESKSFNFSVRNSTGRRLIKFDNGYMGLGPDSSQPGN